MKIVIAVRLALLALLAAKLGRATSFMLKQKRAFDIDRFLLTP